jgi:hypothetical protein
MARRKYTDQQCLEAAQLRDLAVSPKAIAEQVGCSVSSLPHCIARGRALMEMEERKEQAWWHGLSEKAAKELVRRGYKSKADAMDFATETPRYVSKSDAGRRSLYDPMHYRMPWLREGLPPLRISLELYNEVREWLGADPIPPGKGTKG